MTARTPSVALPPRRRPVPNLYAHTTSGQSPLAGAPILDGPAIVDRFLQFVHGESDSLPIRLATASGAFPSTFLLPRVYPLVLDANMIRGELIRVATKGRTILVSAANSGVLRLFVAPHVVSEVERHYPAWAHRKKLDPQALKQAWETEFLPLLRRVDVPQDWTTTDESERLHRLAQRPPVGDPDDVPTATLTLLLGAPLLSRDRLPLQAVYGTDVDMTEHTAWLDALRAGGDLGPLGQYLHLSTNLIVLAGRGALSGLRALATRWNWWAVFMILASAGAATKLLTPPDKLKRIGSRVGEILAVVAEIYASITTAHRNADQQFHTLAAPAPSDHQILSDLRAHESLARLCLRELAQAPESQLSAEDLHDRVSRHFTLPGGVDSVRKQLVRWPAFVHVGDGLYQVGEAIVCSPDDKDSYI